MTGLAQSRPRSVPAGSLVRSLLALALATASWPAAAQDLAAIARKEKERRAKLAKPTKVLTEEDAKAVVAKGAGSVTTVQGGVVSAPDVAEEPGTSPEVQKPQWKKRADDARAAIALSESNLVDAEQTIEQYRTDQSALSAKEAQDPMRLQKREAKMADMVKGLQVKREAVTAAKKAMADLETEARRAGIPAGWLR